MDKIAEARRFYPMISLWIVVLMLCTYLIPVEFLESRESRNNSPEQDYFHLIDVFGPQRGTDIIPNYQRVLTSFGHSTVSDNNGNIYTTGKFWQSQQGTYNDESIDFGVHSLYLSSNEYHARSSDVYIAKYSPTQGWEWVERISSIGTTYNGINAIRELQITLDGSVLIAGQFQSELAIFGSSLTLTNENTTWANVDSFIAKISPQGQWQWAKKIVGEGNEYISDISIDDSGDIFIVGSTDSDCVSFEEGSEQICEPPCNWGANGESGCSTMPQGDPGWNDNGGSHTTFDFFVAKYDSYGNWLNSNTLTTENHYSWTEGHHLAIDADGSVFVSGRIVGYETSLIFAGDLSVSGCGQDCSVEFIGKINSELTNWEWLITDDSVDVHHQHHYWANQIISIESSPLGGAIVQGTIGKPGEYNRIAWNNFGEYNLSISGTNETHRKLDYLSRISSTGEWLWARDIGTGIDYGSGQVYYPETQVPTSLAPLSSTMAVDNFGRIYVHQCKGSTWYSDEGITTYENDGMISVTRYDESGNYDISASLSGFLNSSFYGSKISNICGVHTVEIRSISIDENLNLVLTFDYTGFTGENEYDDFRFSGVVRWRFVSNPNDLDEDEVPNDEDLCPNTDPTDTVNVYGCSPIQLDGDSDGVPNSEDKCPGYDDGDDMDEDGVPNACDSDIDGDSVEIILGNDNCPLVYNPDQANSDGDFVGDACDFDDDNDGVPDTADKCPGGSDSIDDDDDGVPNGCDSDRDGDNFTNSVEEDCGSNWLNENSIPDDNDQDMLCDMMDLDDDNDGIFDQDDNCPMQANTLQIDYDGDSHGDICDLDDDNDGVLDSEDNCDQNDDRVDVDNDGVPDACDNWHPRPQHEAIMWKMGLSSIVWMLFLLAIISRRIY